LLGRTTRSSPSAALRRAEGAGLDGEGADQAIIDIAVISSVLIIGCSRKAVAKLEENWPNAAVHTVRRQRKPAFLIAT
jgi:hypothetical protein